MATTEATNRKSSIGVEMVVKPADGQSIAAWNGTAQLLPAVTDIPDLGATPEQIDVTTIGMKRRAYKEGIKDPGELEFTCFFEHDHYNLLYEAQKADAKMVVTVALPDSKVFTIEGKVSVSIAGFGVGDAITYTLKVAVSKIS